MGLPGPLPLPLALAQALPATRSTGRGGVGWGAPGGPQTFPGPGRPGRGPGREPGGWGGCGGGAAGSPRGRLGASAATSPRGPGRAGPVGGRPGGAPAGGGRMGGPQGGPRPPRRGRPPARHVRGAGAPPAPPQPAPEAPAAAAPRTTCRGPSAPAPPTHPPTHPPLALSPGPAAGVASRLALPSLLRDVGVAAAPAATALLLPLRSGSLSTPDWARWGRRVAFDVRRSASRSLPAAGWAWPGRGRGLRGERGRELPGTGLGRGRMQIRRGLGA